MLRRLVSWLLEDSSRRASAILLFLVAFYCYSSSTTEVYREYFVEIAASRFIDPGTAFLYIFIPPFVASLVSLGFCHERERGTLRGYLALSLSRREILAATILSDYLTVTLPTLAALVVNLLLLDVHATLKAPLKLLSPPVWFEVLSLLLLMLTTLLLAAAFALTLRKALYAFLATVTTLYIMWYISGRIDWLGRYLPPWSFTRLFVVLPLGQLVVDAFGAALLTAAITAAFLISAVHFTKRGEL